MVSWSAWVKKIAGGDLWIWVMQVGWIGGSLLALALRPVAYHDWHLMLLLCAAMIVRPLGGGSEWWDVKSFSIFGMLVGILCPPVVYFVLGLALFLILLQFQIEWARAHADVPKREVESHPADGKLVGFGTDPIQETHHPL